MKYIWQADTWPQFKWDSAVLLPLIGRARALQGGLWERVSTLDASDSLGAQAEVLTEEAVKTSEIEGDRLDRGAVRSSVARRLGLSTAGLPASTRAIDGLVAALLDATTRHTVPLTAARIKQWQAGLFPTGYSGLAKVRVGGWRVTDQPMRVVSGVVGKEKVHYEAPPSRRVPAEMKRFLSWWEHSGNREDGLLRSGVAHLYFVTIHPFDDGNGRISRVLADMALAQDENRSTRIYSMSSQIMEERDAYYQVLERTQRGTGDLTAWLEWYLGCYTRALGRADKIVGNVWVKTRFWQKNGKASLSERQRKVMNRLLDAGKGGFEGGLTTRKYVALAKVSRATAFREIADLVEQGLLSPDPSSQGRNVNYEPVW